MDSTIDKTITGREIAVIGMACRAPGVSTTADLWQLSKSGKEGLSTFTREELKKAGVNEAKLDDPNYVMKTGYLADKNLFDAALFGYSPNQAKIIDPQFSKFHECVWEVLEQGGYHSGWIGVFAGTGDNSAWCNRIINEEDSIADQFDAGTMTGSNFLSTRISYNFKLTGPSKGVQTACSTSLVAVYDACQSLLTYQCKMALAGGGTISPDGIEGYVYQEGMIMSPDGCCRPFDASAAGTIGGEGCGVVLLKRLADALADNDNILAIIKGSATNNDGGRKQSFTAPSVLGQKEAILDALEIAEVAPISIGYVETHGTATYLGDSVEIAALTKAYGPDAIEAKGSEYCVIGALKSLIGHTDTGAGVMGLIRAIQVLQHKQFPPNAYFKSPNPELNLDKTPFRVNTELCDWQSNDPRRAGVSSFGIGGTNAHVILEEACFERQTSKSRNIQMFFLSANTETALAKINDEQLQYLEQHPETSLPDLCYTRQVGRKLLRYRKAMAVSSIDELKQALGDKQDLAGNIHIHTGLAADDNKIGFLFPGQGAQYANMGKGLYETEPVFRQWLDKCFNIAQEKSGIDFKTSLFPTDKSDASINQTENTQPLLFMLEYSLAQQLIHWGCKPDIMIGHSVGEYVAACLAGVFTLEDAITLIIKRGALIQALPSGDMLSVRTDKATIEPILEALNQTKETVGIAAINSPKLLVVSGDQDAIATLQTILDEKDIPHSVLHTSHAFHSHHLDPALAEFKTAVEAVALSSPEPELPYISNVTGTRIDPEQATSPDYWVQHMRGCIQFSQGVETLLEQESLALLEVGPRQVLSTFVQQNLAKTPTHHCVNLMPYAQGIVRVNSENETSTIDQKALFSGLCRLFTLGRTLNWQAFYEEEKRGIIGDLPTYPFEGKAYWIPVQISNKPRKSKSLSGKKPDLSNWFYLPNWTAVTPATLPSIAPEETTNAAQWLIFEDEYGLGEQLSTTLKSTTSDKGQMNIRVRKGQSFAQIEPELYQINPQNKQDYQKLIQALEMQAKLPLHIIHLWSIYAPSVKQSLSERFEQAQQQGFNSVVYLIQSLNTPLSDRTIHLSVITSDVQTITASPAHCSEKAGVFGLNRVIPQEYPNISSRIVDIHLDEGKQWQDNVIPEQLMAELSLDKFPSVAVIRNGVLWAQDFYPLTVPAPIKSKGLRKNGTYLITGGLGNIGIALASFLATEYQASLILTTRYLFPHKSQWEKFIVENPQDSITKKISLFQSLESLGAQIDVRSSDVSKKEDVDTLFQWIDNNYSGLDGVIHAAADIYMVLISDMEPEIMTRYFSAKLQGTANIASCLQNRPVDFCMLFSSLSTLLGGLGYANYAASNCIMDSFVQSLSVIDNTPWISVNWDGWDVAEVGSTQNDKSDNSRSQPAWQYGFSTNQGMRLFQRLVDLFRDKPQCLASNSQVIVSSGSLEERYQFYACEKINDKNEDKPDISMEFMEAPPELFTDYQAPETPMEKALAQIWARKLGVTRIGVADSLFQLGADSLQFISVSSELKSQFNSKLTFGKLLQLSTIQQQAEVLDELQEGDSLVQGSSVIPGKENEKLLCSTQLPPGKKVEKGREVPLSYMQQVLWSCIQEPGMENTYHLVIPFIFYGQLDVAVLKKSLQAIIDRHDILRVHVVEKGTQAVMVTNVTLPFDLTISTADSIEEISILFKKKLEEGFDFYKGPLVKGYLWEIKNKQQWALVVEIHHLLGDGWSAKVLQNELAYLYTCYSQDKVPTLPSLPIQYQDFACWQRQQQQQQLHTDNYRQQLKHWHRKLDKSTGKMLPTDTPRHLVSDYRLAEQGIVITRQLYGKISEFCKYKQITPYVLYMTAFHICLYRYSGINNLIVYSPLAEREQPELNHSIGLHLNYLLIQCQMSEELTVSDILRQVEVQRNFAVQGEINVHVGVIMEQLKDEHKQKILLYSPQFNLVDFPQVESWDLPKVKAESFTLNLTGIPIPFEPALTIQKMPQGVKASLAYINALFKPKTINQIAEGFKQILQVIVTQPNTAVGDIMPR